MSFCSFLKIELNKLIPFSTQGKVISHKRKSVFTNGKNVENSFSKNQKYTTFNR